MTQEEFDKEYKQVERKLMMNKKSFGLDSFVEMLSTEAIYFVLNESDLNIWNLEFIEELNKEFNNRLNTVIEKEVLDN